MADDVISPEELAKIDYKPGSKDWMDPTVEFRKGTFNYGAQPASTAYLGQQNWADAETAFQSALEIRPDDPL